MDEKNISSVMPAEAVILKKPEHGISRRNIDPDALRILFRLHSLGFIAYLTGGAVRDMMLGKLPKDFDIVTNARPGQIRKHFQGVYIIGRRFRLAHIHFRGGKIIEVATFRKNSSLAGQDKSEVRNDPENVYGSPREDALRRDITINALFYDAITASVIDFVGGLDGFAAAPDQRHRRSRRALPGGPRPHLAGDPVRGPGRICIDEEIAREITGHGHLLAQCSGARLYEEFNKDLVHAETRPVIEGLRKYGVLKYIIGRAGEDYEMDGRLFAGLACSWIAKIVKK